MDVQIATIVEAKMEFLFEKIKIEMKSQTDEITNSIKQSFEGKIAELEEKNHELNKKIEELEEKTKFMERQLKRNNILVHGVEQKENEKLIDAIIAVFKEANIVLKKEDINSVRRMGDKSKEKRPVLICMNSFSTKLMLLKNKRKLTDHYITEDYPKEVLEKRRSLQEQLQQEKDKGNKVYIKYDQLVVIPKSNPTITNPNKRPLDISPPHTQNNMASASSPGTSQPPISKLNKTDAFAVMRSQK